MSTKQYPNKEELHRLFEYDADTGDLKWKVKPKYSRKCAGDVAGTLRQQGHKAVMIQQSWYFCHRVIWIMHHDIDDKFPLLVVDHIDGNRGNNRLENLRLATKSENDCNRKTTIASKLGIKNVWYVPSRKCFRVVIKRKGYPTYRKEFKTLEEAKANAIEKRKELHGEFANHGTT